MIIAKFPAKGDTLDIPRIEQATMALAAKCGIRVPGCAASPGRRKNALLVRRFDREKGGEATIENALSRAVRFGLSEDHARAEVGSLARIVHGWKEHFAFAGCPDSEIGALGPSFARAETDVPQS